MATAQNFRTDSAIVGPIASAASDMTGGDSFVILAAIPNTNILYALGYDSTKAVKLLAGGLGAYVTGNTYSSSSGYVLPYFKYRKPVTPASANYDEGDDYYTVGVYSDLAGTNRVGTLKTSTTSGLIVDTASGNDNDAIQLVTDDASTFPGLPSLLSGVGYYMPEVTPSLIMTVPSTGTITSGNYAGLPDTTPGTPVEMNPGTRFYACPLKFFSTANCTDSKLAATNLIYQQCSRTAASSTASDRTAAYYTGFCGNNAKTGLTSVSLCQLTNGTIPYYAYANGTCGTKWPADYALIGMDGKTYTANSTYGMSYDGLCLVNDKTNPTSYKSMSLQDAFDQLIDEGDIDPHTPDNGGGSTPWWMWLLLVLLIIGIIIMAVLLFMNMGKSGSKTEVNSHGNLEKVTVEDK